MTGICNSNHVFSGLIQKESSNYTHLTLLSPTACQSSTTSPTSLLFWQKFFWRTQIRKTISNLQESSMKNMRC